MYYKRKLLSVIVILFLCLYLACSKPFITDTPTQNPGSYTAPKLPAVVDNYISQPMPAYINEFLTTYPGIDNTPANNPITNNGATLGRVLFYDKQLSVNNKISCASCHHQDKAFTDGEQFSKGFENKLTRRNAMPLANLRYFLGKKMFWDLRADDLEQQSIMPITDLIEMGMPSMTKLVEKLKTLPYYKELFIRAFGSPDITTDRIAKALSQFLRSIESFNSKYDQGLSNQFANFTQEELNGKTNIIRFFCTECHSDLKTAGNRNNPSFLVVENFGLNNKKLGNNFLGTNNGLDDIYKDNGIGEVTKQPQDIGTFKTPSLRNIALTAPYMHDGRFKTLEEVLEHYRTGIKAHPNRGMQIQAGGIPLSLKEKNEIIAFLKTLTDASLATNAKYSDPFK